MSFEISDNVGIASPDQLADLTGLEQLQKMLSGEFPTPPIAHVLNFTLTGASEGRAEFTGEPKADYFNPMGIIHGGWMATLLDSAMGCAVHSVLNPRETYTTLEYKVNCVRAVTAQTGKMVCEGKIIHRGRTIATSEAALKDAKGKLYAHGVTTCMVFPL